MTQPGETDGYTARQHLETIKKYAPEIHFDFVVVNDRRISQEQAERYAAEGAYQIGIDDDASTTRSIKRRKSCAPTCSMKAKRSDTTRIAWRRLCSPAGNKRCYRRGLSIIIGESISCLTPAHQHRPLDVLIMAAGFGNADEIEARESAARTRWPAVDRSRLASGPGSGSTKDLSSWLVIRLRKLSRRCWLKLASWRAL